MEHAGRRRCDGADATANGTAVARAATITMLVATVVSMWALSAMAVTVRHGRSRMARWAQQQHSDVQPPTPDVAVVVATSTTDDRLSHDPGGGGASSGPGSAMHAGGDGQLHQRHRDKANSLLRIVESQQQLGGNCTAGTDLNMGEGVVDRYAQASTGDNSSRIPSPRAREISVTPSENVGAREFFSETEDIIRRNFLSNAFFFFLTD